VACRALVAHTRARRRWTHLLADGADDAEANHRWRRADLGRERIMPPVTGRPSRGVTTRPYRRQRPLVCLRTVDGQRWTAEPLISVAKRRGGGAVTARRDWPQVKQTRWCGVTDDRYRAVQRGLSVHLRSHRLDKAAA